jgi:hypothetical protein
MRLIGAGLPRTGTTSLRVALERLLDGPVYHMAILVENPGHVAAWHRALDGDPEQILTVLDDYTAAIAWPAAAVWRELAEHWPQAPVVLSRRNSAEEWWHSMNETVLTRARGPRDTLEPWQQLFVRLLRDLTGDARWDDQDLMVKGFARHNRDVRAQAEPGRLFEWTAEEGWAPLCERLCVQVPQGPFPHVNTREDVRARRAARSVASSSPPGDVPTGRQP